MKKYDGYEKAEAFTGEFKTLEPGGYICKILKVQAEEKDYGTLLRIGFDIAEGEHEGYYKRRFESKKQSNPDAKWPGMYYQPIIQADLRYFKGFMTSLEVSNPGFKWNWDENKLVGKLFGGIFGEEEYEKQDGSIGTTVKCRFVRSVDAIREGEFKTPEKKLLNPANTGWKQVEDDDELPF
ncbi:MAG TPA: hypothetical protein P5523_06530 [Bacteroidales bacterium]|nr:hypothetical protein [Bacteroidales bacterium]